MSIGSDGKVNPQMEFVGIDIKDDERAADNGHVETIVSVLERRKPASAWEWLVLVIKRTGLPAEIHERERLILFPDRNWPEKLAAALPR